MTIEDKKTRMYFDSQTPHYNPARIEPSLEFLKTHSHPDSMLIDIGCGDGSILELIKQQTEISNLFGMDVSETYLEKANLVSGCTTILGSILDEQIISSNLNQFDFAILASVLHHLIGKDRIQSQELALKSFINSLRVLKSGGYLILFEPGHGPKWIMDIIFYIKKLFSRFSGERIELFQKWFNLGQPIVSYYTPKQLDQMIMSVSDTCLVERKIISHRWLGGVIEMTAISYILQKLTN